MNEETNKKMDEILGKKRPPVRFEEGETFERLDKDKFDSDRMKGGLFNLFLIVDGLLKSRGAVYRDLKNEKNLGVYILTLFLISTLFTAAYGAIMGFFAGDKQILYSTIKLPIIFGGSLILCIPTFYIFNSILGAKLSFGQTIMLLLCMAAPAALILIGFTPISWFFSISSGNVGFMSVLHMIVFAIASFFGFGCLQTINKYVEYLETGGVTTTGNFITLWSGIYTFVVCQMLYYFKPLLVSGPFFTGERGFFFMIFKTLGKD